ncbi:MAG: hypothetical protein K2P87_06980 [Lachnospiraceae bacterium]|nr:hypothetical protein [Lachnospiraceae bacterium]
MRKEFSYAKLIKISSIVYCAVTILFFLLLNMAAGFIGQAVENGQDVNGVIEFTGAQQFCIAAVNILIYVELFGYFAVLWMVFMFFLKKNQYSKAHRPWPATEKFPLWFFLAGLVFFLIFMSMMKAMLPGA